MKKAPNILLITTDQQRYDTLGSSAPPFLRTPHLDLLARQSVRFSRAYAQCPLCTPARMSIMTGQSPARNGILWFNYEPVERDRTLPSRLSRLGYHTAAIGKMHFHPYRNRHGFDEMIITEDYFRQMARLGGPQPLRHGVGQNEAFPTCSTVHETQSITHWTADQTVEFLTERRDPTRPFFLWSSFSKPHPPFDPPEPYYSMYRNEAIPGALRSAWSAGDQCPIALRRMREQMSFDLVPPEIVREARSAYYGLVTQVDYSLGRVFAALQERGLWDETLIIFTSDHGEYLGDFGNFCKNLFHEPSSRVPFMMRVPGNADGSLRGLDCAALVTHADILATCVAVGGGECGDETDGVNLIDVITGRIPPRTYLDGICETNPPSRLAVESIRAWIGTTDGRWKYIWYPEGSREQFFDLLSDPNELHDHSQTPARQDEKNRLRDALILTHSSATHVRHGFVRDGNLVGYPERLETTLQRRSSPWPALQTGDAKGDAKH